MMYWSCMTISRAGRNFGLALFLFCLVVPPILAAAEAERCPVCGRVLSGEVYLLDDRVTLQKQSVCKSCLLSFPSCSVCGLPANTNAPGFVQLPDGRAICPRDTSTAIISEEDGLRTWREVREGLDRRLSRFMNLANPNITVAMVDRVDLQKLFKSPGQDRSCPNVFGLIQTRRSPNGIEHRISLLSGIPVGWFRATCAHEWAHAWMEENLPTARKLAISHDSVEGFCEFISYRFMEGQNDEATKSRILLNAYTRGQVQLLIEAEDRCGLNDVLDWMKYGVDGSLSAGALDRIRSVQIPRTATPIAAVQVPVRVPAPQSPDSLKLKAVFWDKRHPSVLINNRTFRVNEQGSVQLGTSNVLLRCQVIRKNAVQIQWVDSGQEQVLSFRGR